VSGVGTERSEPGAPVTAGPTGRTGRLTGVGVGPGDPELVTVRAARLIAEADVIAYHHTGHTDGIARAAAAPYLRGGQLEEPLRYPVTTEATDHPGGYAVALADFYDDAGRRLAAHLDAGRDVVVLCEGDPSFYGSYQHLHARLAGRYQAEVVPGVSSLAAAAAAAGEPLVQHDESLTVLAGTMPAERLRSRIEDGEAVAILKLGRSFERVRDALDAAGMLDRARYVERAGTPAQRVAPLAEVDPATVPYMSLALVPGRGVRDARPEPVARSGVTVVGLGPGDPAWQTPEVTEALAAATDLVGYRPYLARVPERPGQRRHGSGNTVEAERAALALDLAAAGGRVVVVSSGDPGVFAMASAVIEVAVAGGERWRDVEVTVLPGVTAAQAVASRVGAPLGHDWCAISLSDRLKPWATVADRIDKAAAADLVLVLYNPASRRRTWQVSAARDLVLRHRDPATPVVVGRAVGREGERVAVTTLAALDPADVDMSTLLIIGSSTTGATERHGRPVVFTPRRYPPEPANGRAVTRAAKTGPAAPAHAAHPAHPSGPAHPAG
jgi:precorrin-2 C20-methyltransferase / precorrin-3B C17-methyltransferase